VPVSNQTDSEAFVSALDDSRALLFEAQLELVPPFEEQIRDLGRFASNLGQATTNRTCVCLRKPHEKILSQRGH
jgi:hypothetical protein